MDNKKLERLRKRQAVKKKIESGNIKYCNVDDKLINQHLNSEVNEKNIYKFERITLYKDFDVFDSEIEELLTSIRNVYDEKQLQLLIDDCKKNVLDSIITPFGIGKFISSYDKIGGNVDTIHNVRNGIYATDKEKNAYENRSKYNPDDYHKDEAYKKINKKKSELKKSGKAEDYMTGKKLKVNEKADLDHSVSAKEIHDDPGRILAEIDGKELANTETNLGLTNSQINRSKKADPMDDFLKRKNENIKRIKLLKSKSNLSDKEQNELKKLEALAKIDDDKAKEYDKNSREEINKEINRRYYSSKKFFSNTLKTSTLEGAKMGLQQAVGLLLKELAESIFDEIMDIFRNGFKNEEEINESFFKILKNRLLRIGNRVLSKWQNVVQAFGEGFFSGFLSNIITIVTNMFVTTGGKIIRIIREGFLSLLKAFKMLLIPPANMKRKEAAHEATKLITSGLVISGGIILEDFLDNFLIGLPFANLVSNVLIGLATGIVSSLIVFEIDRLDVFGVNSDKRHEFIIAELDKKINSSFEKVEKILVDLENRSLLI